MNIRDEAALDLASRLDELLEVCKKGAAVEKKCPNLSADVRRKAGALKNSLERLKKALDEAGPPPQWLKEREPLYMRLSEHKELQEIARLLGHHGVLEDDLFALTKKLAAQVGDHRVSDAIKELVWIDRTTRWAHLRPEVIRVLRPVIGPLPDAEDFERWWKDRGGPPPFRSPQTEKARREQQPREEPKAQEKPAKQTRARKSA